MGSRYIPEAATTRNPMAIFRRYYFNRPAARPKWGLNDFVAGGDIDSGQPPAAGQSHYSVAREFRKSCAIVCWKGEPVLSYETSVDVGQERSLPGRQAFPKQRCFDVDSEVPSRVHYRRLF
ncbi:hypothetical protein ACVMIX_002574 [Rhizobium leguminosarum]